MKSWLILCIVLSFYGGILKLILMATGGEKVAKTLQTILSVLMFSLAIGAIGKEEFPSISFSNLDKSEYYRDLQDETLEEVFFYAEDALETSLSTELKAKFGITPVKCTVSIDRETFEMSKIQICYSSADILISTYEIKNYIYNTYRIEPEVIFD